MRGTHRRLREKSRRSVAIRMSTYSLTLTAVIVNSPKIKIAISELIDHSLIDQISIEVLGIKGDLFIFNNFPKWVPEKPLKV